MSSAGKIQRKNLDSGSFFNNPHEAGMTRARGLIVCNIGAGKGKTTAAMGVVARAAGAGMNVFVLQFVKAGPLAENENDNENERKAQGEWPVANEIKFFNAAELPSGFGKIETEVCGVGFVGILGDEKDKEVHVQAAKEGLVRAREAMHSGRYELVVLDEILSAVEVSLLTEDEVVELIKNKPHDLHLIIKGHNKYPKVLELCDTVTEMKMIKHAYYEGVLAVEGIDY